MLTKKEKKKKRREVNQKHQTSLLVYKWKRQERRGQALMTVIWKYSVTFCKEQDQIENDGVLLYFPSTKSV